jgi:SPP1 gp7 family putative phage head morphogenesis protein
MAKRVRQPAAELEILQHSTHAGLVDALARLAAGQLEGDERAARDGELDLADQLGEAMAAADLFGRRRLILEASAAAGQRLYAAPGPLPQVGFVEAVGEILRRYPSAAAGWRDARDKYAAGAFALARAASVKVAGHVRDVIERAVKLGTPQDEAVADILKSLRSGSQDVDGGARYTNAYSETIFRTNLATAYTEGRLEQVRDPNIRKVIGGFRFDAIEDSATRENHRALDGFTAATTDPVWKRLKPPLGYNCRCALVMVPHTQMTAAHNTDGFARFKAGDWGTGPDQGFRQL